MTSIWTSHSSVISLAFSRCGLMNQMTAAGSFVSTFTGYYNLPVSCLIEPPATRLLRPVDELFVKSLKLAMKANPSTDAAPIVGLVVLNEGQNCIFLILTCRSYSCHYVYCAVIHIHLSLLPCVQYAQYGYAFGWVSLEVVVRDICYI